MGARIVKLSRSDITTLEQILRRVVREEIANANHSRARSAAGIAAPVEGDDRCDEKTERESMDLTSTEINGDSMSLQQAEERGRRLMIAIQRGNLPRQRSQVQTRKRKAAP